MEYEDSQIVEKCLQGDRSAFGIIVERYKKQIYSVAYSMTHNHSDADDLSQDTFIKAFENLRKFKLGTNFRSWLYRIAVNLCIDNLRHKKRFPENNLDDQEKMLPNQDPDPQIQIESSELMKSIMAAVNSLPEKQRIVVILSEIEGLKLKDIAETIKCPESTIRCRLHYARKKLQEKLRDYMNSK